MTGHDVIADQAGIELVPLESTRAPV